jgi:AbrB family looped-hinge helix DNA binding protein
MALAKSKVTAQGQISIPVAVRKKLGIVPGSTLEWVEEGDRIVIRRTGKYSFEDIRKAIWGDKPVPSKTDEEIEEGLKKYFRKRYARP